MTCKFFIGFDIRDAKNLSNEELAKKIFGQIKIFGERNKAEAQKSDENADSC